MRKMALSEIAFKELELFALGYKATEIREIIGRPVDQIRIKEAFFRIVNFGYNGIIPEHISPVLKPEELCKNVFSRVHYSDFAFRYYSPTPKSEFLSDTFKCGCDSSTTVLSMDNDIRYLDLSAIAFGAIVRCYNNKGPYCNQRFQSGPFTIRNLISLKENELLKFRRFGAGCLTELKEELKKHGFQLESTKPSLESIISNAQHQTLSNKELKEKLLDNSIDLNR